ncbi:hypothetical protein Tco_0539751, partial [Tanacetum coccineum]
LFHIPGVTHDAITLRAFPITLTGAARNWKNMLPARGHLTQECILKKDDKVVEHVSYIGFLKKTVNKFMEESIKRQAIIDEWIKKYKENTELNLKKLDAATKNLQVKADQLTQAILTNHMVNKVKTKMRKELILFYLPIVNQYVEPTTPPIPFLRRLKEHVVEPYINRESVYVIGISKETNEDEPSCVMKTNVELNSFIKQLNPLHKSTSEEIMKQTEVTGDNGNLTSDVCINQPTAWSSA